MTRTAHGPQTTLAVFRPRLDPIPVRVRGPRRCELEDVAGACLEAVGAATVAFASEWPEAACSVCSVDIVPEVDGRRGSHEHLATASTGLQFGRVFSRVQLSYSLFLDPTMAGQLEAWQSSGDLVSSDLEGVVWHEWGHVLLNSLVLRAEPLSRSSESGAEIVVSEALGRDSTASAVIAASHLSKRARQSREEFVAEAVSDFGVRGHRADPISVAIVMVLAELWHS